jgi:hypothetical protein
VEEEHSVLLAEVFSTLQAQILFLNFLAFPLLWLPPVRTELPYIVFLLIILVRQGTNHVTDTGLAPCAYAILLASQAKKTKNMVDLLLTPHDSDGPKEKPVY